MASGLLKRFFIGFSPVACPDCEKKAQHGARRVLVRVGGRRVCGIRDGRDAAAAGAGPAGVVERGGVDGAGGEEGGDEEEAGGAGAAAFGQPGLYRGRFVGEQRREACATRGGGHAHE